MLGFLLENKVTWAIEKAHFDCDQLFFRYLNGGDTRTDEADDIERFNTWKANLVILGIHCMDVLKVMAAILLLGNVNFHEGNGGLELDMHGKEELNNVASLVGVSPSLLLQGMKSYLFNQDDKLHLHVV